MSRLSQWLDRITAEEAQKFCYLPIKPEHTDVAAAATPILAGKHYFRLWVTEMYLTNKRTWFSEWEPAVCGIVRVQYANQQPEISHIAGAADLKDLTSSSLNNVVQLNYPMTTLLPFKGGTVELMVGLLALKTKDYLSDFLTTMNDFSKLLVVPQLSAALQIAGPLATAIGKLVDGGGNQLHLGLHQTLVGQVGGQNVLRSGYYAVIAAEEGAVERDKLWVVDDRLRYGDDLQRSQPFKRNDSLLLRIEAQTGRDDWNLLSTIAEPHDKMVEALGRGDGQTASQFKAAAQTAALLSPDLTEVDRKVVRAVLEEEFKELSSQKSKGLNISHHLSLNWAINTSPYGARAREAAAAKPAAEARESGREGGGRAKSRRSAAKGARASRRR